jgi:hypothetical protein
MLTMPAPLATSDLIGRDPDRLTIAERTAVAGKWVAMEIYTPKKLPLRRIEAIGDSVDECAADLRRRGLDPKAFEFSVLAPSY